MINRHRFEQELNDHAEDSGDPSIIGKEEELQAAFALYKKSHDQRNFLTVVVVVLITFLFSGLFMNEHWDTGLNRNNPIVIILDSVSFYSSVLMMFITLPLSNVMNTQIYWIIFPFFLQRFMEA